MLELGRVESVKSQVRDARAGASLDVFMQDVRYGLRSLRRTPGFTSAAIVTLALGIGANTAMFTLLDAVVFKPLPVPAPHELVTLYENAPGTVPDTTGGGGRYLRFSYPRFERLQQAIGTQGALAAVTRSTRFIVRFPGNSQVTPVEGQLVSGSYFATLGVSAARGRLLTAGDARGDRIEPVAVVSHGFWKRSLGATDAAVGQTLVVNGVGVTVVGVTPPGFVGVWTDGEPDVWLPLDVAGGPPPSDQLERVQQRRSKPAVGHAGPHRLAEPDRPGRAGRSDARDGAAAGCESHGRDRAGGDPGTRAGTARDARAHARGRIVCAGILRLARTILECALRADGHGGGRAARDLRQHRQPHAGPRGAALA